MFDIMDYSALKTGYGSGRIKDPAVFALDIKAGKPLRDRVSGVEASVNIAGDRWGLVNGVLTRFGTNQARVTDDGVCFCSAFTQLAKYSEDLTNAAWGKTRCSIVQGENYMGMTTWKIQEDTSAGYHIFSYPTPVQPDNSVFGLCFIAKRAGRNIGVGITPKTGVNVTAYYNLNTGVIFSGTASYKSITPLGNGYFLCFMAHNIGVGSQSQNINFVPVTDAGVDSYQGDGVSGPIISQPTTINFGVNGVPFVPPYTPNNTNNSISVPSEVGTSTNGISIPVKSNSRLLNAKKYIQGPNAKGQIRIKFKTNLNSNWLPNSTDCNILSCRNSPTSILRYRKYSDGSTVFGSIDSADNVCNSPSISVSPGQTFNIIIDYGPHPQGGSKMRLTVNGQRSALAPFNGSWGTEDIVFGFGNTIDVGSISDFTIYPNPNF